ncbi:hypothetical protein llg_05230 [Luteolibacter sp. LG18]|nr:hypothetical protein llg_05230 [Luteolibacter sp. LG18]
MPAPQPHRLRFIFPSDVIEPRKPDEAFLDQIEAFREAGFPTSVVSIEYLQMGERRIHPRPEPDETVVYRGWMMNAADYRAFCEAVSATGAMPLTGADTYLACHHLPNWYPFIAEFTPRTVTFPPDADLASELKALDWEAYFIKDHVKSLKTDSGSILRSTEGVGRLVADMVKFRGEIEGGFCVREVEDFIPESEVRYFVILGIPFSNDPNQPVPDIVVEAASRIRSPFFSVDVIRRSDGVERIVEIGDGQVSDVVGWTPARLAAAWKHQAGQPPR